MDILLLAFGAAFLFFGLAFILMYNSLVQKKIQIENAWSQIDVQLKRRYDLVPNLVETVKGYVKHEKALFENVTKARAAALGATGVSDKAQAENMLSSTLKSLFAVAENYPDLKANENFKMLQEELAGIENKIAYARQFYNDSVLSYNTAIHSVPTNVVAAMFGFTPKEFFRAEESEKQSVKVQF
ncbi:MAG: LemA family protein [Candidatus Micrarchaeota archaeon]|nr:LemA family protein [Candidatus Micrarchaeota archaeon]